MIKIKTKLKKLTYLFLALIIFACSDDDSSDNNSSNTIEGRWNLTSTITNGTGDLLSSCDLQSYMLLSENNSGIFYQYYTDDPETEPCGLDVTYSVNLEYITNNTYSMTLVSNYDGYSETGTAEINNNILLYSISYGQDNFEVRFVKE